VDYNSLLWYERRGWHDGSGTLTYSFLTSVPAYYRDREDVTGDGRDDIVYIAEDMSIGVRADLAMKAAEQAMVRLAVEAWNDVANINLVPGTTGPDSRFGDITFASAPFAERELFGMVAEFPGEPGLPSVHGDIWLNRNNDLQATARYGNTGWQTIIHELGHALGLYHPDEDPFNDGGHPNNNQRYTVMSYVEHPGQSGALDEGALSWPVTPMIWDIQALQALYGPNLATRAGATTYFGPALSGTKSAYSLLDGGRLSTGYIAIMTIWDAGGRDTISAANQTKTVTINLNNGAFSTIGNIHEGIAIAEKVVIDRVVVNRIENAIGGAAADTLIGNEGANLLDGGAGADTMRGGDGTDVYRIDHVGDRVIETLEGGTDTVQTALDYRLTSVVERLVLTGNAAVSGTGNSYANTITGNRAANLLDGGTGNDVLNGAAGNDRLDGGRGSDSLSGGLGADMFLFDEGDSGQARWTGDRILDFTVGEGDRIDLRPIDARSATPDIDNRFTFVGTDAFSGNGVGGQLRYEQVRGTTYVSGDVDGDGAADFFIRIDGAHDLVATDFLL
jgi:serralysin